MKVFITLIASWFFSQNIQAQTSLSGRVTDKEGNGLFGVNVYLKDTYNGGSTDSTGNFQFLMGEENKGIIIASFIGYKTYESHIDLSSVNKISITLDEAINKIDGITISAGAFEASDKKKSVVLRTFDIVTTAGATADITGVMNTLPGTQTVGEEGRLFVRGGAGHEAKTFINGLLVAQPYDLTPQNIPSRFRFNPFLFKGAFFSTGGYSAEYGQALSSVLQLNTNDLPARSQTDISIMSVGADVSHTIRKKNTSLYGQVQYTDLSPYFALVPQNYEWKRAPNSINATFHLKQKYRESGQIQTYLNFDDSRMNIEQPSPGNIYENVKYDIRNKNLYSNISLQDALNEKLSYRGGVSFTKNSSITKNEDFYLETLLSSMHTKFALDHDVNEKVILKYGAEWVMYNYDEKVWNIEDETEHRQTLNNHLMSPFLEADIYFSNKFMA